MRLPRGLTRPGEVDGNGANGEFAQFIVHHRSGHVMLQVGRRPLATRVMCGRTSSTRTAGWPSATVRARVCNTVTDSLQAS